MRRLPPLNAIRAFEATARRRSISRAARELLVTHGAVSKQIRILEDHVGELLFERSTTGVALTSAGVELAAALGPIFKDLHAAFGARAGAKRTKRVCRLSTVASFAAQFLMPRMRSFQKEHPTISLQVLTTTRLVDFEKEAVDVAIRYGSGNWPGVESEPVGGDVLLAVCAPSVIEEADSDDPGEILASAPLIHQDSTSDWNAWLESAGFAAIDAQSGLFLEDASLAVRATIDGQGVGLLPSILIQRELKAGLLRKISSLHLHVNRQYYLAHPKGAALAEHVRDVIDWIHKEVRAALAATEL